MRERRTEQFQGEEEELPRDRGDPDRSEELWPPEGQTFQRNRQVCKPDTHVISLRQWASQEATDVADLHPGS